MSCGMLKMKDKNVLLVGGGKKAYQKACELLQDEAIITCLSLEFVEELKQLPITLLHKQYDASDITMDYFMVYAVSEDRECNHQVVMDTNAKNIISASYHKDEDATFHVMKYEQYDDLTVALSTSGKYPAFTKTVFDDIQKVYKERHDERLRNLGIIRDYMLKEKIEKKYLLEDLLSASVEELKFYANAIRTNKAFIMVFHGVKQKEMYAKILQLIIAMGYDKTALYFSYIDDEALSQYHYFEEMNRILSLDKIKKTLKLLHIKEVVYQPMLFDKGENYKKMVHILKHEKVNDLLFTSHMLEAIMPLYLPAGNNLLVLPPLSDAKLKEDIINLHIPNVYVMMMNEELPEMKVKGALNLVSFYMLSDDDIMRSTFGNKGVFMKLLEHDYDGEAYRKLLIEDDAFIAYMKTLIQ